MKKLALALTGLFALTVAMTSTALAGGWVKHKSNKYGISMLVPKGARVQAKEIPGGCLRQQQAVACCDLPVSEMENTQGEDAITVELGPEVTAVAEAFSSTQRVVAVGKDFLVASDGDNLYFFPFTIHK